MPASLTNSRGRNHCAEAFRKCQRKEKRPIGLQRIRWPFSLLKHSGLSPPDCSSSRRQWVRFSGEPSLSFTLSLGSGGCFLRAAVWFGISLRTSLSLASRVMQRGCQKPDRPARKSVYEVQTIANKPNYCSGLWRFVFLSLSLRSVMPKSEFEVR